MAAISFENVLPLAASLLTMNANVGITEGSSTANWGDNLPGLPASSNASIIQVDQATTLTFTWNATGMLNWIIKSCSMKVDAFFELMGPGEASFAVPSATLPAMLPVSGFTTIVIPSGTVPEGVYRLVVRMMLIPPTGATPGTSPICGFTDLNLVEYYKG